MVPKLGGCCEHEQSALRCNRCSFGDCVHDYSPFVQFFGDDLCLLDNIRPLGSVCC